MRFDPGIFRIQARSVVRSQNKPRLFELYTKVWPDRREKAKYLPPPLRAFEKNGKNERK
jgi:hypothetical protein